MMQSFFYNIGSKVIIKAVMTYKQSKYMPTIQYIKNNKNNQIFGEHEKESFLNQNEFIKNKKIISISPGGYKGIYMLGICMYMKEHFDLSDFIFSGSSAGAWNALMMCYNKDNSLLKHDIVDYSVKNSKSLNQIEMMMKTRILEKCSQDDFDLRRLFIGVTTVNNYRANITIFSGFDSLEDSIDCCVASSHIPLVTGGFVNKYNNMYSFDGGFSKYPYLNITQSVLHITPSIWTKKRENPSLIQDINDYTTLFSKNNFDFDKMYKNGYEDAHKNCVFLKHVLDTEFIE